MSDQHMIASSPLRRADKTTGELVDWTSMAQAAQPKTLFTIGVGNTNEKPQPTSAFKSKVNNRSTGAGKSHVEGFLKKMKVNFPFWL